MASLARKRFLARGKRAVRHMLPPHIIRSHLTAGVIKNFADRMGMVYFGAVHHNDEGHRLIRGHTVSHSHLDHHYAVGSVRGYDIAMVLRNDVVLAAGDRREQRCHWLIMTVDLHTKNDVPHLYIGHRNRDNAFRASFEQITPLYIGATGRYPASFLDAYTVYGQAINTIAIERTITPQMSEVIVSHFEHASIEIEDGTVYLYIESQRPTTGQLEKLLSNTLWLAECIDTANP